MDGHSLTYLEQHFDALRGKSLGQGVANVVASHATTTTTAATTTTTTTTTNINNQHQRHVVPPAQVQAAVHKHPIRRSAP